MKSIHKWKLSYALHTFYLVPLLILGFIITVMGYQWFSKAMQQEIQVELDIIAHNILTILDLSHPGDYQLVDNKASLRLYKGEDDITNDNDLLDKLKKDNGVDITIFYQDTRILTTIHDMKQERIVGSGAANQVLHDVLRTGESHFYPNTHINYVEYFSYYMPLINSDEQIVGMIFVGKPREQINHAIRIAIFPLIIANIIIMLFVSFLLSLYLRKFSKVLQNFHQYFTEVSLGNLNTELDPIVLNRSDEIGDIGRSAVTMQRSLRNLIERDSLTTLYNRRFAEDKLKQIKSPFCVALGDIDFFKKVNDNYGHDCGDLVLKQIANILKFHMKNTGFVARWGGEEFLLVFQHSSHENALNILEKIMHDIRSGELIYEDHTVKVTMTFGIEEGTDDEIHDLIRRADDKLYQGKSSGRNKIIS